MFRSFCEHACRPEYSTPLTLTLTRPHPHQALSIAVQILTDLMTFNKIEAGMMALHRETVPVLDYVGGCVETLAAEARERSVNIVVTNEYGAALAPNGMKMSSSQSGLRGRSMFFRHKQSRSVSVDPTAGIFPILPGDNVFCDKYKVS